MTTFQKTMKYLAIAIAIMLIVAIIGGALKTLEFVFGGVKSAVDDAPSEYAVSSDITKLDIDIAAADLVIKSGDKLFVESNLKDLKVKENGGKLTIEDKGKKSLDRSEASLTLTVPAGYEFEKVKISTGAGRLTADNVSAKDLELDLGAGEVTIGALYGSVSTDIDGGAGKVTVLGGALNNLDLDMGIGKLELTAQLSGSGELDLGVGETVLTLIGTPDDYSLSFDKGIGSVSLEGESVKSGEIYGEGNSRVRVECGVGSVKLGFMNKARNL